MRIKRIKLKNRNPVKIVVEMTIEQAAEIVKWTGPLTPATGSSDETGAMYDELVTTVFNPYWSDGVDGYLRGETE